MDELRSVERLQLVDLAHQLRIRTPSLYAHVESLDDLRRSLALLGLHELRERINRAASGHRGVEALLAIASECRAYALERPGVYIAAALSPRDDAWAKALAELKDTFSTVLSRYGITGDDATDCVRAIRSAVHGFIVLEAQGDYGQPDPAASFERLMSIVLRGLVHDAKPTAGDGATHRRLKRPRAAK